MPTTTITQFTNETFIDETFSLGLEQTDSVSISPTVIALQNLEIPSRTTLIKGSGMGVDGNDVPFGTVSSVEFFDSGALIATWTGFSVDLLSFVAFVFDDADLDELEQYDVVWDASGVASGEVTFYDGGTLFGDTAIAGPGGSYMEMGEAADTYIGGSGFDQISFNWETGGNGASADLNAGTATDTYGNIESIQGSIESLRGSEWADTFLGSDTRNHMRGLAGDDILDGRGGVDLVRYDRDTNYGGSSGVSVDLMAETATDGFGDTDTVRNFEDVIATVYDDVIVGNSAANSLTGLDGDDIFRGYAGNDQYFGGEGMDTVRFDDATGGVNVYLQFTSNIGSGEGRDSFDSIEIIIGSGFGDRLIADANDNILNGANGDDIIKGKGGDDVFYGGDGDDRIIGGEAIDVMFGGIDSDILVGLGGEDFLFGDEGDDFVYGGRDSDQVYGDEGEDRVRGNLGNDTLYGGDGDDDVRGGGSNDTLFGGADNDFLVGDNGSDILDGGAGNDVLRGGRSDGSFDFKQDTFVYSTGFGGGGFDRVKDFENDVDLIDLTSFGFADFTTDVLSLASSANGGADMRLNFGAGDVLYLENFTLAQFEQSDVVLV